MSDDEAMDQAQIDWKLDVDCLVASVSSIGSSDMDDILGQLIAQRDALFRQNTRWLMLGNYQALAMRTNVVDERMAPGGYPVYYALGLAGEAGELADKIKKAWRNQKPLDNIAVLRELGDVLWYLTAIAVHLGSSLEEVAAMNIDKLADRAARGVIKSEGDDR